MSTPREQILERCLNRAINELERIKRYSGDLDVESIDNVLQRIQEEKGEKEDAQINR